MAKMRIHELAKEISENNTALDQKTLTADIVKLLQESGSDVKNHMSSVSDEEASKIRKQFSAKTAEKPAEKPAEPATDTAADKNQAKDAADEAKKTGAGKAQQNKNSQGGQSRYPMEGKLLGPGGKYVYYKVAKDGRLINKENLKPLPLKMTYDGRITSLDGKPLMKKPSVSQPVNQVFDGRSETDKKKAATAAQYKISKKHTAEEPVKEEKPEQPAEGAAVKQEIPAQSAAAVAEHSEKAVEAAPVQNISVQEQKEESVKTEESKAEQPREQVKKPYNDRGQGERRPYADRAQGERRPYGDRAQGDRGQGERRPYGDRPQGERRPYGDRAQGDRTQGERRPYGDRPQGERRPFGDRPQGDRGQGERRPYGDRPQGERRPYGDRPQGERRPYGDRPQGDRPAYGDRRPAGGFGGKDKDDDNQRRTFTRKNDSRPAGSSIKSELANELGKGQRAESLKDRNRDKNRKDRDRDFEEDGVKAGKNKKDPNRKGAFIKPVAKPQEKQEDEIKTIVIPEVITIKELADKMKQSSAAIIKKLFLGGKMVNVNSEISFEEAEEIALEYEIICEKEVKVNVVEELLKEAEEDPATLEKRPPVVCVMGHVDHGKTSLLDAIRETNVTAREAGGITQHIGAYMVEINGEKITFLDTPGHEAFTSMRMRGAKSTDIAILVIAADDGVMPQTVEAINHAKAANVQIIVAVNKIDKPGANIDRVKQELTEHGLVAEDWGGDTVFVPVSAKTGEGIENLLEMVLLTADVCELKANPNRRARGIVIEAQLDKGRGPVATVLIQKGTLNVGDNVAIGATHGKVRAMIDDKGRKVKTATPSTPVEILGLNGVPEAGEVVMAVSDEKEARNIAEAFISQSKEKLIAETKAKMTLDGLFSQIQAGEVKELNLIVKADVMGSVEAVKQSLTKLSNEEVVVRVIHGGVGNINESDVNLASASNAIIIGFNVKPDNTAKDIADREKVDVRLYKVIYNAIDDIEMAMKGMLKPIYQEKVIGHAEVRQLFKASGLGVIAGSFVLDGKIERGCSARISREGKQIFEGPLASLKRFKDDVKEVAAGYECGLVFEKFSDLAELDQIEFYVMEEIKRT